jgi:rubredoxin
MAYLKYYADENRRHFHAQQSKLTREQALESARVLARAFAVPPLKVGFTDKLPGRKTRKVKSWYQGGRELAAGDFFQLPQAQIALHPEMLNVLTVAHEFAHYIDDIDQRKARREWSAKYMVAEKYAFRVPAPRWNAHGPRHEVIVNKAVAILKEKGFMPPLPEPGATVAAPVLPTVPSPPKPNAVQMATDFFNSLPAMHWCPKCGVIKPKEDFGVRVMARDSAGLPVKMARQSYCRKCR